MNSQPFYERRPQPSSLPSFQKVNKQRAASWFSKPSFLRFKSKSSSLSHSPSSHSSLSSDPSLSRAQSPSITTSSKDSIIYASSTVSSNQEGHGVVAIKKSSRVRQTLDAMSSTIAIHSSRPIHSTAAITAPQTTPDYRQPIPNFLSTVSMVPGVCVHLAFT